MSSSVDLSVRPVQTPDLDTICAIYNHYVLHSLSTFAETPLSMDTFRSKYQSLCSLHLPFLVATRSLSGTNVIVGFTYASPYAERSGYRYTLETTIYVAPGYSRQGIGSALLQSLVEACQKNGPWGTLVAIIGDAPVPGGDEEASSNRASIALHERHGFVQSGRLKNMGWKMNQWVDCVYMQRSLTPAARHPGDPPL
ncbi:GCN5-related N-acetyltransferase [Peniophora sp. CONT]|nr:GCN5-related N-acetyltransferase [Peniophora sp. CONT]